ncbi:hypothetical protein [Motilimonas sp. KMU-193]|uniref:hypothetical protein n=1 Tax=Motilimonas sp. KMU-193 TaxID=3388668 RepID=UPI00396AF4D2
MIRTSSNTPLEIYHGVPEGWSKAEIISEYQSLGGTELADLPEATEPGSPSWLPDRQNWLQYRATIKEIAELVRVGDPAAIELAVRYIELNYFGSYSGFLRERLARALKQQNLTGVQCSRLLSHFSQLISERQCFTEFREFSKLAKRIKSRQNA